MATNHFLTRRSTRGYLVLALACLLTTFVAVPARADDVWLHQTEIPRPPRKGATQGPAVAFLWMPPEAKHLRGLIVAQKTLLEKRLAVDPIIRRAAADEQLAILYLEPGLDPFFAYGDQGDWDRRFLDGLTDLAVKSGHAELGRVPWLTLGHSTGGIFARNIAYWKPDRMLGVIHIKSGNMHQGIQDTDKASLAGVPFLAINGEFEEFGPEGGLRQEYGRQTQWVMIRKQMLARRRQEPSHLMSLVVHPGGNHTDWSDDLSRLCALFIRKACQYRMPSPWPTHAAPVACRKIDPASGWLSDSDLKAPRHEPAAYDDYRGDKGLSFWHFDKEMALAVADYHRGAFDKPDPAVDRDKYPGPGDDRTVPDKR